MIDHDDGDTFWLMALFADHPIAALIFLVIAIGIACVAWQNDEECQKRHCPNGAKPVLQNSACQCVIEASP